MIEELIKKIATFKNAIEQINVKPKMSTPSADTNIAKPEAPKPNLAPKSKKDPRKMADQILDKDKKQEQQKVADKNKGKLVASKNGQWQIK